MTVLSPRMRAHLAIAAVVVASCWLGGIAPANAEPHVVRKGQTLSGIAQRYGCTLGEIKAKNGLRGDGIRAGQKLEIPASCKSAPEAVVAGSAKADKPAKPARLRRLSHEVIEGETLEMIALRYGMPLEDLEKDNARALKAGLKPGLRLKVVSSSEERAQRKITYTIESGDTLGSIARRFGMSTKDIMRMNPGKKPERLRIGDRLTIYKEGKATRSQAVGKPQRGRLVNGEQMKNVPGAHFRRPLYTWGTNETVRALKAAIAEVRRKHPKAHDLVIGDLSRENGGFLAPHKSHQSGLDADIGFYFRNQPREGPRVNLSAATSAMDYEANWTLITALAGQSEEASNVEYMFIGYRVQEKLYKWAKENGISDKKLDWLFQYPRGSRAMSGLIRNEPGHDNHIHIRFKCPRGDACL
jgi:LysM repeat protein